MDFSGIVSTNYPLYDFDLRATHARTLLPAALASVSFGFVLVRVRVPRCTEVDEKPGKKHDIIVSFLMNSNSN